jgi:DNA-binding NtrC family response regulator
MAVAKILVVDDDEFVRLSMGQGLEQNGFEVTTAATMTEALEHIRSQKYDVLLSKLALPDNGDGPSLVSAVRDGNPGAVTLLLSGYAGTEDAAQVIRMQSDEIFARPIDLISLVEVVRNRVASGPFQPLVVESVATILDRETQTAIQESYGRAQLDPELMAVPNEQRNALCLSDSTVPRPSDSSPLP